MVKEITITEEMTRGVDEHYNIWFICPECKGEDIAPWFKFCPECGAKIKFKEGKQNEPK